MWVSVKVVDYLSKAVNHLYICPHHIVKDFSLKHFIDTMHDDTEVVISMQRLLTVLVQNKKCKVGS